MGPKCHKCIFVGYGEESKEFHFYDLASNEVIIQRHIVFKDTFPSSSLPFPSTLDSFDVSPINVLSFLDYMSIDFDCEITTIESPRDDPRALESSSP